MITIIIIIVIIHCETTAPSVLTMLELLLSLVIMTIMTCVMRRDGTRVECVSISLHQMHLQQIALATMNATHDRHEWHRLVSMVKARNSNGCLKLQRGGYGDGSNKQQQ